LQVFFAVECDLFRLDLTIFDFNFVPAEDDGDVFADPRQVTVPVGHVFVGDPRGYVKHNDGALTLDVVTITETTKLFLTRCVPHIEFDGPTVRMECERVDFHTERGNIFLFKLSRQVPLYERGFAYTTIAHKNKLEFWDFLSLRKG